MVEALTPTKMASYFESQRQCDVWVDSVVGSLPFFKRFFFFTHTHFPLSWKPTIPKSNYTRELVDTKSHRLFMFICYHQNHYFIYLIVIYLVISSCNSSYPSGVAVAQRLAPFGVARFLYADVEKKPENGEPISIYKAAVSIVSDFKWNTLPSPVDTFFGFI